VIPLSIQDLNLVISDTAEPTIEETACLVLLLLKSYNFFGRSLNHWAELALTEHEMKKMKLKKLCTARRSSRIDEVRALKNRYEAADAHHPEKQQ